MHYQSPNEPSLALRQSGVIILISFIRFIKRRKSAFILLTLALSLVGYLFYIKTLYYESSIELFINTASASKTISENEVEAKSTINTSGTLKRVYQIVFSDEMVDQLNEKFDLYKIFEIPNSSYSKSVLIKKLRTKISLKVNQYDVVTINVQDDEQSQRASDMANFIAVEALALNRKWYMEQMLQRLQIDSLLNGQMRSTIEVEKNFFNNNISILNNIFLKKAGYTNTQLTGVYQSLYSSLVSLNNHLEKYEEDCRSNGAILATLNDKSFSQMIIIKKALPTKRVNELAAYQVWPAILIISTFLSITILYIYFHLLRFIKSVKSADLMMRSN